MTARTSTADLAGTFEALQAEALAIIVDCSDDQWQQTTSAEGWTVAATAHHMAIVQRGFVGIVEQLAAGETYTPAIDMEQIHKSNAEHAREYAEADREETLEILESSGAEMAKLIRSFDGDDLDRTAGTFGGNDLTVAQFIEYVVIGHCREHLTSVRETINV